MKKNILVLALIFVSVFSYSQTDTCYADFCYVAVLDTNYTTLNVTFYNNSTSTYSIVSHYWVFGDGSQDTIENPVHYYFIADSFYVSLEILSSTGCWDTFVDTIYIGNTCDSTTQLNRKPENYKIKLFPTVIDYYFKIENNNYCKPMEFNMFDIWGRKVMELEISEQETEATRNNLPSGLYFYSIFFEENVIKTGKLLFK